MGISGEEYLATRKSKKRDRKNKSRKLGRNFKYYGKEHSMTLYRSRGQREINKARRAAKRERRLQLLRDKKNGVHLKEHRSEEAESIASGSGSSQRKHEGRQHRHREAEQWPSQGSAEALIHMPGQPGHR